MRPEAQELMDLGNEISELSCKYRETRKRIAKEYKITRDCGIKVEDNESPMLVIDDSINAIGNMARKNPTLLQDIKKNLLLPAKQVGALLFKVNEKYEDYINSTLIEINSSNDESYKRHLHKEQMEVFTAWGDSPSNNFFYAFTQVVNMLPVLHRDSDIPESEGYKCKLYDTKPTIYPLSDVGYLERIVEDINGKNIEINKMEIPDKYKGTGIVSLFQHSNGGIAMFKYDIDQFELYKKDKAEMEREGNTFFAELIGINCILSNAMNSCLTTLDRTKKYVPGDIDLKRPESDRAS